MTHGTQANSCEHIQAGSAFVALSWRFQAFLAEVEALHWQPVHCAIPQQWLSAAVMALVTWEFRLRIPGMRSEALQLHLDCANLGMATRLWGHQGSAATEYCTSNVNEGVQR